MDRPRHGRPRRSPAAPAGGRPAADVTAVARRAPTIAALVRVIAEEAQVHTGPGFGFRVVYSAKLNEVLPAIGRASHDHWFRVELPDGTYGWILGDEVFPLDVDTAAAHEGPSVWKRMGDRRLLAAAARRGERRLHLLGRRPGRRRHVPLPPLVAAGAARLAGGDDRRDGRQPGRRHLRRRRASTPSCSPRRR